MNSSLVFFRPLHMAAVLGALCAGSACADMLVLSAEADGQYDYGIQRDPNHGLVVLLGDEITLSGLSGVTAASVLPDLAFAFSLGTVSATSVTIVDTTAFVPGEPYYFGATGNFIRFINWSRGLPDPD